MPSLGGGGGASRLLSRSGVSSALSRGSERARTKFGGGGRGGGGGGGGGGGVGGGKLRRPLMSGSLGPASDDYGFIPLEEDPTASGAARDAGGGSDGAGAASDGYESASSSAGSSMSARSARSLGSVMGRRKSKKKDRRKKKKKKKDGTTGDGGGGGSKKRRGVLRRRRRNSGTTGVNTSLAQQGRSGRDDSELDRDTNDDDCSSTGGSWSCLSFLTDMAGGSHSADGGGGSFPSSPPSDPSGRAPSRRRSKSVDGGSRGGGGGGGGKRSPRHFLFPASPSSLWRCATPSSSSDRDDDGENDQRDRAPHPGPNCCSSPRIGPDGHALAASVPPVPPFLLVRSRSEASSGSNSGHSSSGGGYGGRRSDRESDGGSSVGASSWADALAGAAVFGTGMAARAAGMSANGGCVPYSHRSAVTDGGEPQPDGPTSMERRALRPNGSHLAASHWSDGNRRGYMEDRYAIEPMGTVTIEPTTAASTPISSGSPKNRHALEHTPSPRGVDELALVPYGDPPPGPGQSLDLDHPDFPRPYHHNPKGSGSERVVVPATLYSVYDGHGGPNASQYCSDWMATYLRRQHPWPTDLPGALRAAFVEADEDFVSSGHLDGTTACSVLILGSDRMLCANAGDSRAVVVRGDGSAARVSRDHKPGSPDETRRIAELGGRVMYVGGRWRVEGTLAVSRGVGDAGLKPYICADPEICEYDLDEDDLFLVVATDGIWDVMENEYVANIVLRKATTAAGEDGAGASSSARRTNPARLRAVARKLCDEARRQGSSDNLCAIVVDLKSSIHPLSRPAQAHHHW